MRKALMLCLALIASAAIVAVAESPTTPALLIEMIEPINAWLHGGSGSVILTVHIARDGRVDRIVRNTASKQLQPLYELYCKQWRYQPAFRDGQAVESTKTYQISYTVTSTFKELPNP